MKFHEVYDLLKEGKHVARESWAPSGSYLSWLVGGEYLFLVTRNEKTDGKGYALTVSDMDASDWKEMTWAEIMAFGKEAEVVEVLDAA